MIEENEKLLLFSTTGESMFPFIRWNEQILVKKVSPEKIERENVILFQSAQGSKVCHRVVKIEDKDGRLWFQTKGDRNSFYDPPVNQQAVLGKVIAVKRRMQLRELSAEGVSAFLYELDCFLARSIFHLRKLLGKTISLLQQYRLYKRVFGPLLLKNIEFKMLREEDEYKFFASKNNQIIAQVYLNYSEENPHLGWWTWSLKVRILYRRLGIGRRLLENVIEFVRKKGGCNLYLNVSGENSAALRFYEGLGFRVIPGSERFYEPNRRTFIYMKREI